MMAPKYGGLRRYGSSSLKPSATSANFPVRSGTRIEVMMPPKLITRTSTPAALVRVYRSTDSPAGVRPNALLLTVPFSATEASGAGFCASVFAHAARRRTRHSGIGFMGGHRLLRDAGG